MILERDLSALPRTPLRALLRQTLPQSDNPLELCMQLLEKSAETRSDALQSATLRVYLKWMERNRAIHENSLDKAFMDCAFDLFMKKFSDEPYDNHKTGINSRWQHLHQFVVIFSKFELLSDSLTGYIEDLLSENDYISAGYFIAVASLQHKFPSLLTEVLQPVYLQQGSSSKIVKDLLDGHPSLQDDFTDWLIDCAQKSEVELQEIVMKKVKFGKSKTKRRAVDLLLNYHHEETAPLGAGNGNSLLAKPALGKLIFIWKMWKGLDKQRALNDIQYAEHMQYALEDARLRDIFVSFLRRRGENGEAARWESFNAATTVERRNGDLLTRYELDGYSVEFIGASSVADIEKVISALRSVRDDVVAFDFENRPVYKCDCESALLQIAFRKRVFLIDLLPAQRKELKSTFVRLLRELFCSSNIKIGFGIDGDLISITSLLPEFANAAPINVVDMRSLAHRLMKSPIDAHFQMKLSEWEKNGDSLAKLSKYCLAKELDKSEQLSNFDMRPLRKAQMDYAARDVTVLLEIYGIFGSLTIGKTPFERYIQQIKNSKKWQK